MPQVSAAQYRDLIRLQQDRVIAVTGTSGPLPISLLTRPDHAPA
jgi:hypothetical protein